MIAWLSLKMTAILDFLDDFRRWSQTHKNPFFIKVEDVFWPYSILVNDSSQKTKSPTDNLGTCGLCLQRSTEYSVKEQPGYPLSEEGNAVKNAE